MQHAVQSPIINHYLFVVMQCNGLGNTPIYLLVGMCYFTYNNNII